MSRPNELIDFPTWHGIHEHVHHARRKHPVFATSKWQATRVLLSEVREFLWAVFWERDAARVREEAFDVVAVLIRWIEGDMRHGGIQHGNK